MKFDFLAYKTPIGAAIEANDIEAVKILLTRKDIDLLNEHISNQVF